MKRFKFVVTVSGEIELVIEAKTALQAKEIAQDFSNMAFLDQRSLPDGCIVFEKWLKLKCGRAMEQK